MKKVLFCASVYQHLSAFHKPYMRWFLEKGYEVHAVGSNNLGRKDELEEMGVICHDIDFARLPFSRENLKAYKQLSNLFSEYYFELIHTHTPTASLLIRHAAFKAKQGKIIYTAHGFHFFEGASKKNWLLFYPAEKMAAKWTDLLIVMNQEDLVSGENLGFKVGEDLFLVNGVGVDLREYAIDNQNGDRNLKQELMLSEDAVLISCIAELSSRKNQFFLLENWKEIVASVPDIHLVLVGKGPDEQMLKNYIIKNNIFNVHLLGYRKDIPQILASSDIVTLVSKQEGLPRCLMEGMALKKPIITTNIRGSSDLVVNDETGLLVNLNDNKALVEAIIKLATNENLRSIFGENGGIKIQDYCIDNVLEDMTKIYEEQL